MRTWYLIGASVFAVVAVTAVIIAPGWMVYFQPQELEATAESIAIASARQAVLLAAGGVIALVGVVVSLYRNQRESAHASLERDQHWTHRYTEAGTMLGSSSESTRLAGIYALLRLGLEAEQPQDVDTIASVLSAPLRDTISGPTEDPSEATRPGGLGKRDREALIDAIRTLSPRTTRRLILTRANLSGADLTGAMLTSAILTGADLTEAKLTRATLTGVDLTDAVLPGANLTGANLAGADLNKARLTRANLTGANLTGAYLIGADLTSAYLTRANLTEATLIGADLTHADLTSANLTVADLTIANLASANLTNANMTDADLVHAILPPGWGDNPEPDAG